MTPAERARLAALAEAATPGPWEAVHEHAGHHVALVGDLSIIGSDAAESSADNIDAAFIAASRAAVPDLLAALADAEAERARLRERVKLAEAMLAKLEAVAEAARTAHARIAHGVERQSAALVCGDLRASDDAIEEIDSARMVLCDALAALEGGE